MPQVTASRADRSDGIPIGELSRLTGVNIETIRYYEKIKMDKDGAPPRVPKVAVVCMDQPKSVCSLSSDAAGSLVSVSKTSALCSPWERRRTHPAGMCAKLLHTILMISAPRSLTFGSYVKRLLSKTIAQCSGSNAPDCPVVDVLDVRRS
jgi:MerR family transcriptional regulator, mercuric resistance operon regulatory protein